jgi:hypothetical protein
VRVLFGLLVLLTAATAAAQDAPPAPAETAPSESPAAPEDAAAEVELRAPDDAPAPKVAILLLGDPDEPAVAAVEAVAAALGASASVRLPADPALCQALVGRGADDGLDDVRRERRGLGLSERRDLPVLVRLGRLSTAAALVLVRAEGTGYAIVVLDVGREAYFDGSLTLPADAAEVVRFVERRALAAAAARDTPRTSEAAPEPAPEPVDEGAAEPEPEAAPDGEPEDAPTGDPVARWFEENWAYLAAGALLVGGVVFVAVVAADPGAPPPMLRFTPGAPP